MTAITTYKTFTDGLADLVVVGVGRRFNGPPASIAGADLPAQWTALPRGSEPAWTFDGGGGWPAMTCDLMIAVEAVGQNTQSGNYDKTIEIIDNLSTALRGASVGRSKLAWEITANVQVQVADITYWAVMATVEGR